MDNGAIGLGSSDKRDFLGPERRDSKRVIYSFGGKPLRLRTYLNLFAFALLFPLLSLSFLALNWMAEVEKSRIEARVLLAAREIASQIDRDLDRALATLETLATSSELRAGDLRAFHRQAVLASKPSKTALVLVDRTYQQLVDTLKDYGSELPPTADPETAQRVIETGKPQVSNLFKGSISGRPVFNVEAPVFDAEGRVRYVLIMSFQAAYIADLLRHSLLDPTWIAGVTDRSGIILARSQRHDEFVGQPLPSDLFAQTQAAGGVYRAVNVAGEPILRATVRSKLAGWFVSATVPVSRVEEPRQRGLSFAVLLLTASVVSGAALAYGFGRMMTRPLNQTTALAASLGRGEYVQAITSSLVEANLISETLERASVDLRTSADHSTFLVRELAHRAKNQLAVVKGMALQTARKSTTIDEFITGFDKRIEGLSQSQDLLLRQNWRGATMRDLVRAHIELFGVGDRVQIEGPDVFLDTTAVQNLGFALHELVTNALKHGALSAKEGTVLLRWWATNEGAVQLEWKEKGAQGTPNLARSGFGSRVIRELVPGALQTSAELEFLEGGVRWCIVIPASHVLVEHS
jgi:two-component sensor histidine kinase